jgi:hypothetical protein
MALTAAAAAAIVTQSTSILTDNSRRPVPSSGAFFGLET